MNTFKPITARKDAQRGAALIVVLLLLIIVTLLGLASMRGALMQERMAANYRTTNLAFQNAEALARTTECGLERLNEVPDVPAGNCAVVNRSDISTRCDDGFDAGVWVDARVLADAPASSVRQIEGCIIGESEIAMGQTQETGGGLQPIYQITTYQTDTDGAANPSSAAAIDTIFKL